MRFYRTSTIVESKRKKPETILKQYPDAILADVTSGGKGWIGETESILSAWWYSCAF